VRFLGPVRYREWNPAQYLDFRAFLDFGGGKLTDLGAHWIDVAPCSWARMRRSPR
jgi:Oxidoreductase family, C-terminal alpha/beta domain